MKNLSLAGLLLLLAFSSPSQSAPNSQIRLTRPIDLALVSAAQKGQTEQIDSLLKKGADIKTAGSQALHAAVEAGHPAVVRILIKQGAPIPFQALIRAVAPFYSTVNAVDMTQILVDGGARVNEIGLGEIDQRPTTPLITAIRNGDDGKRLNVAELLLSRGAKVDLALPDGSTALDAAVDSPERALLLIEHGASLTKHKHRLLSNALTRESPALLAALRERGAVPEKLTFAAFNFPTNIFAVKTILAAGGNPNERNKYLKGWTPLHFAARSSELESISALLDARADIEAKGDHWHDEQAQEGLVGASPAFFAGEFQNHPGDDIRALELLLKRGANPNAVETHNGFTLLMWKAIYGQQPKAVITLLKAGAKVNAVDRQGQTVLHLAAINDNTESVRLILKANHTHAFVEARDNKGQTALLRAIGGLTQQSVNVRAPLKDLGILFPTLAALFKAGADIRAKDKTGATALHLIAASPTRDDIFKVEYLRQRGLKSVDLRDNQGSTPLLIACEQGNDDLAQYLLYLGANPNLRNLKGLSARQVVTQPAHLTRPPASSAAEKKYIEAWFHEMDKGVTARRQKILAFIRMREKGASSSSRKPLKRATRTY